MKAIKEANQVANYLEYKAELVPENEYEKSNTYEKMSNQISSGEPGSPESAIRKAIETSGFKPTNSLIQSFSQLNKKSNKFFQVYDMKLVQDGSLKLDLEEKIIADKIIKECRLQELNSLPCAER